MSLKKLIIFDTNALLDMYSYKSDTVKKILDHFLKQKEILYIPEQCYIEYSRNRYASRRIKRNKYSVFKEEIIKKINTWKDEVDKISNEKILTPFDTCISKASNKVIDELNNLVKTVEEEVNEIIEDINEFQDDGNDNIYCFVNEIYNLCNSTKYTIQDKIKISLEADKRFELGLRPGLSDKSKEAKLDDKFAKYGDVIIWKDILSKTNYEKVIFITNERKQDWWDNVEERKIAKELLTEWKEHGGKKLEFISLGNFLDIHCDGGFDFKIIQEVNECNFSNLIDENTEKIFEYLDKKTYIDEYIDEYDLEYELLGEVIAGGNVEDINDLIFQDLRLDEKTFKIINSDLNDKKVYVQVSGDLYVEASFSVAYGRDRYESGGFDVRSDACIKVTFNIEIKIESMLLFDLYIADVKHDINSVYISDSAEFWDEVEY